MKVKRRANMKNGTKINGRHSRESAREKTMAGKGFQAAAERFYAALRSLETGMATSSAAVSVKKKAISSILDDFISASKKEMAKLNSSVDEELKATIAGNDEMLMEVVSKWAKELDNYLKINDFVKEFEDKFLVIVFGKVNSGKSTLGNVISGIKYRRGANGEPAAVIETYADPEFFMYDRSNIKNHIDNLAELETDGFKVKETESTSSIQGFTLSGLSWVDTPGIHSLTKENEELAKKYVNGADLVIYVMSSDSPAKASDMAEIEGLIEKEKNFIVVVTKSDTTEEDEAGGEIVTAIVPKSDRDREDQSCYCESELAKLNCGDKLRNRKVIHTSYPLYMEALAAGDANIAAASGYDELYRVLGRVFTAEAAYLKARSPIGRLNGFINTILTERGARNIHGVRKAFTDNLAEIESSMARLEKIKARIAGGAIFAVDAELDAIVNRCADGGVPAGEMMSMIGEAVGAAVKNAAVPAIESEIKSFNRRYAENFTMNLDGLGIDFEQRYAEYTYKETTHTVFYGTGGGILGGAIGFFAGGPIGAFVGSLIGTAAGSALGDYDVRVRTGRVHAGDNRHEVLAAVKDNVKPAIYEACDSIIERIRVHYYMSLKSSLETVLLNIDHLVLKMKNLKNRS